MGTVQHRFEQDLATVYAAYTDADHMTRRCEAFGQTNIECTVTEKGAVTEVVLARDIESDIPSFAKKVVDPVNRVAVTLRWRDQGDGKHADYDVSVNARISISGTIDLRADGDGCRHDERFEAKVKIPLVGGKIAKLVDKETVSGVTKDLGWSDKELKG